MSTNRKELSTIIRNIASMFKFLCRKTKNQYQMECNKNDIIAPVSAIWW